MGAIKTFVLTFLSLVGFFFLLQPLTKLSVYLLTYLKVYHLPWWKCLLSGFLVLAVVAFLDEIFFSGGRGR